MRCPGCSKEAPEGGGFCAYCGAALRPGDGTSEAAAPVLPAAAAAPPPPPPNAVAAPPPAPYAASPPSRGKGLAVGLSALAVLLAGGTVLLLVLLLTGSGGTSVQDYRDRVGRIMDESHAELAGVEWASLDPSGMDQQAIDDFARLSEDLQAVLPFFEDAQAELESITPPEQAAGLHQDILDYYAESITTLRSLESMVVYGTGIVQAAMRLNDGMNSFSSQMSGVSSQQEFTALMDQALGVMDEFVATASGLKPPPFMADFNTALIAAMREMRDIFQEMGKAVANGNAAALSAVEAKLEKAEADFDSKIDGSTREMKRFIRRLENLERELQDLNEQLDELA